MSFNYSDPTAFNAGFPGQEQKPRGWWKRNWKWLVPTSFLCMFIFCCGCPVAIFVGIGGIIRNSEPYLIAMEKIQASPEAQEAFGQPIHDNSWIVLGEINKDLTNGSGNAELRWDLAGPKGKGKAYVKARMTDGKWELETLEVILPDGKKIDLHDEDGGNKIPPLQGQGNAESDKAN
jgi:hypothetical protein